MLLLTGNEIEVTNSWNLLLAPHHMVSLSSIVSDSDSGKKLDLYFRKRTMVYDVTFCFISLVREMKQNVTS